MTERLTPLRAIVASTMALALIGAACGSSGDDTSSAAESANTTAAAVPADAPATSDFLGEYELMDDDHGTVVSVTLTDTERVITGNGLPNHETGDFPNSGNPNTISEQEVSVSIPIEPTLTGEATSVKEPGITVAGVKFDPGTAERATCDDGTVYSVEALQDVLDLGLDVNNAHVQPTGAYHYHGASDLLADTVSTSDEDLVHVGFAYDGHLVYYSQSGAYTTSYSLIDDDRTGSDCTWSNQQTGEEVVFEGDTPDGSFTQDWEYVEGSGDLDACNGVEIDGTYVYVMTDTYPYISRCLMGEVADGLAGPSGGEGGPGDGQGPPPDGEGP